jgi:spore coat protein H
MATVAFRRLLNFRTILFAAFITAVTAGAANSDVIINEIMYHPPMEMEELQYVELYNRGKAEVDLSHWAFTKGIKLTFPEKTRIPAGGYLVVCRNVQVFEANYKGVKAVGDFTGKLSHRGERIELHDANGAVMDSIKFSDRDPWPTGPDGHSASLERISPWGPSDDPANWAGSPLPTFEKPAGTPGKKNDNFAEKLPPAISKVRIPAPTPMQPTTISANVADETGIKSVTLLWRVAHSGGEMKDKEVVMEREKGDEKKGTYTGVIEPLPEGQLVRFRIKATSNGGLSRVSPEPTAPRPAHSFSTFVNTNGATVPFAYLIYVSPEQKDEIMSVRYPDKVDVQAGPTARNAAFIYAPAGGGTVETYDYVQARPRKGGFKVHFLKDDRFKGMSGINVISEGPARWLLTEPLAYELYKAANVPAPLTEHLRVWIDGRPIGYQLLIEQPNKAFLKRNDRDDTGHMYKVIWFENGLIKQHEKHTRPAEGHTDLVAMHKKLTGASGAAQWQYIEQNFNVEEFTGYYAVNMCIQNWDGFFNNYWLYHDTGDTGKWEMYPWDEDKTWGDYDGASPQYDWYSMPLRFGADDANFGEGGGWVRPPGFFSGPLLKNEMFRKKFLARLRDICERSFTEAKMLPLMDAMEKRLEPEVAVRAKINGEDPKAAVSLLHSDMDSIRRQLKNRREFILQAIPKDSASK